MGWLTGYDCRKSITINHTADGAQTNYQLQLAIVKGAGSDSGATVYLNNNALNWPNDIRFTKSDGSTQIDFWREESDATDGTWWIEFDTIPAHPTDGSFYMYYGKASDTDASNGSNTFLFFDDFSGDLSKWDVNEGTWAIVSGQLKKTSADGNADIYSNNTIAIPSSGYRVQSYLSAAAGSTETVGIAPQKDVTDPATGYYSFTFGIGDFMDKISEWTGAAWTDVIASGDATTVATFGYTKTSAGAFNLLKNGSSIGTGSDTTVTDTGVNWYLRIYSYQQNTIFDTIFVANFTANVPTFGTWGAAELDLSCTDGFKEGDSNSDTVTVNCVAVDGITLGESSTGDITLTITVTDGFKLGDITSNELAGVILLLGRAKAYGFINKLIKGYGDGTSRAKGYGEIRGQEK